MNLLSIIDEQERLIHLRSIREERYKINTIRKKESPDNEKGPYTNSDKAVYVTISPAGIELARTLIYY